MTAKEYLIERNLWYTKDNKIELTDDALASLMSQYAHYKCLEAIKNTRYKSYDLVDFQVTGDQIVDKILQNIQRDIQNIKNEDVLPKL